MIRLDADQKNEVRVCTYPRLYVQMKNLLDKTNQWVMVQRFGAFNQWRRALQFCMQWQHKSRGRAPLMAKGIVLGQRYRVPMRVRRPRPLPSLPPPPPPPAQTQEQKVYEILELR